MTDPFARLGFAMARLRWLVIGVWLVVVVGAVVLFAPNAASVLKGGGYVLPGSESDQAESILRDQFNASTASNLLAVFSTDGTPIDTPEIAAEVTGALDRIAENEGVEQVASFYNTGDPTLISEDRQTTVAIISLTGTEGEMQERVAELREELEGLSVEHNITGTPAINLDIQATSEEDLRKAELFTIPIVLILLLLVFRSVIAAAIPLIMGAGSVVVTLAILYLIGQQTDVSIFALNVASMIGLALGIDFSLICVSRFREELAAGRSTSAAVAMTMATAGRSITYSAITVILGMLVLTALFGLMIVRSISLGVMLVAAVALLAGLTLLPAVMAALGQKINALQVIPRRAAAPAKSGVWYRLSHAIMRRPVLWLAVSLVILIGLAIPTKDVLLYGSTAKILPGEAQSAAGVEQLTEAFGSSRLTPIQIVIDAGEPGSVWKPEFLGALAELNDQLAADDRVADIFWLGTLTGDIPPEEFRALTPEAFTSDPAQAAAASRFVNLGGQNDVAVITVISEYEQYDTRHESLVYDIRDDYIPAVPQLTIYDVNVGGDSARIIDFKDFLYGRFPFLVLAVMALTFVILMMFFQSVFLPLKAILMNLVSILATYGVLVLIFQHGFGSNLLGFDSIGRIGSLTPAILFAVLFGLSTDYEVFMLSRVKEYFHATGDNDESVATGLEHTGSVITAAGLILIGTFGSFGIADIVIVKEIGIGLAIGALIDSTIVRIIMVPATMKLMGSVNWWMPAWLRRIVPELREGPAGDIEDPRGAVPAPAGLPGTLAPAYATGVMQSSATYEASPHGHLTADPPPAAPMLIGRLCCTGSSVGVDEIDLDPGTRFRIGRDASSELQLFDVRVSRRHALIEYRDGQYVITDLGSANGVYVNDVRITEPRPLQPGDQIEIGNMNTVTFRFELVPATHEAMQR